MWSYQANVMKTLEKINRTMAARMTCMKISSGGGLERRGLPRHPCQAAGPVAARTGAELATHTRAARPGHGRHVGRHPVKREGGQAGMAHRLARRRRYAMLVRRVYRKVFQSLCEQMTQKAV